MEWLTRAWEFIRDVGLTGLGAYLLLKQAAAAHPNGLVLGTGLALLTPAGHAAWQQLSGAGSRQRPSPPEPPQPPQPSQLSSGDASHG